MLYHLKRNGFQAYLVGGGVRDILLNATVKDFDIATNAHPEQIKRIFRNCLLIGKRFRIAHIRFPGDIIEVTTFRAAEAKGDHRRLSAKGMLLRDNVYGDIHEDVWRRDFSMNALYYNIEDFSVVDYCNGLEDIQNQCIRMIGEPKKRYQEDPVRLLRAIRLAAKFPAFHFDPDTEMGLSQQASLLSYVPSSRLFEEVLKLFHYGQALPTYHLLNKYGLLKELFPTVDTERSTQWIETALLHTDRRFGEGKTLAPAFLFATLLWPALLEETDKYTKEGLPYSIAYQQAMRSVLMYQHQVTSLTRFCSQMIRDIWSMQPLLLKQYPSQINRLLAHPRFRAAYDFLLLRVAFKEVPEQVTMVWQHRANFATLEESI